MELFDSFKFKNFTLSQGLGLTKYAIKEVAYLLVTYAIELRAEELYSSTIQIRSKKYRIKSSYQVHSFGGKRTS